MFAKKKEEGRRKREEGKGKKEEKVMVKPDFDFSTHRELLTASDLRD
ncbi:hypothetical protein QUA62_26845 [Microcoleus sp. MON1_C1]|nr:hypothetical protein [Microcoleus sp. FACHB-84]MBD2010092.1 hypothetical protein [Microcoleus sp. FACHB-45]